jgi:DNA-binding XRE family transcriptional regulator
MIRYYRIIYELSDFITCIFTFSCKIRQIFVLILYIGAVFFEKYPTFPVMAVGENKMLKEFGKNLKKLRIQKGFSTRKFAHEADIAASFLAMLEAGASNPSLTTLLKIAEALDVDLNALVPKK